MFIKLERKLLAVLLLTLFLGHLPMSYVNAQIVDSSGHTHNVNAVSWSHNGTFLASASRDETIKLWTEDGEFARLYQSPIVGELDIILNIEWSPNDKLLASSGVNRTVFIWNTTSDDLRPKVVAQRHFDYVKGIAWHPNASENGVIATGGNDGYSRLWNATFPTFTKDVNGNDTKKLSTESVINNFLTHQKSVSDMKWSSDGKILSSVGIDGTHKIIANRSNGDYSILENIGFVDTTDPDPLVEFDEPIHGFDISSDDTYYVYVLENSVVMYEATAPFNPSSSFGAFPNMLEVDSLDVTCGADCINMDVEFSPDNNYVAIAAGKTVKVYSMDGGSFDTEKFSFDASSLADGSDYFDASTKAVSVSWHPNSQVLAFAAGPDVFVYDVETQQEVFRIEGTLPATSDVILIVLLTILVVIVLYLIYRRVR